jgi:hypothetical protein
MIAIVWDRAADFALEVFTFPIIALLLPIVTAMCSFMP